MSNLLCKIIGIKIVNEIEYYIVKSIDEEVEYFVQRNFQLNHNVEIGKDYYFIKSISPKNKKVHLVLNQSGSYLYEQNIQYYFNILSFKISYNKKGELLNLIIVEDENKNKLSVIALKWQKKQIWNFDKLKCEVKQIKQNGSLVLVNVDYRHPFYEKGKKYEFEIIDEKIKKNDSGSFEIYLVKGIDNCIHEVNMLPGQMFKVNKTSTISCKIIEITTHLKLSQVDIEDPYYVSFSQIIKDDKLKRKYFLSILNDKNLTDKHCLKFKEQYNSKHAFWVFTFTNKILPFYFDQSISKFDYISANEINDLILKFELWIINSGIITSFPNDDIKKNTRDKAQLKYDSCIEKKKALTFFISYPFDYINILALENKIGIELIYNVIKFSEINIIDIDKLATIIDNLIKTYVTLKENEINFFKKFIYLINAKKKVFFSEENIKYFSLSANNYETSILSEQEKKYIFITICELKIAKKIGYNENFNINCGHILKLLTKATTDSKEREKLLYYSYRYFDNYQDIIYKIPFVYNTTVEVDFEYLENRFRIETNDGVWLEMQENLINKQTFTVCLTKKSKTGYEVKYKNLKGFLPYHHIKEITLRRYPLDIFNYEIQTNCICIAASKVFNFFIVEQIESQNGEENFRISVEIKIGTLYNAVVNQVTNYGLFVRTEIGEGLLHINQIFDFDWDTREIFDFFKEGQKIKVELISKNETNKLFFCFKSLKLKDTVYYKNYIEQLLSYNTSDLFETNIIKENDFYFDKALNEKAFCLEQYAVLQFDINQKLHNFQIAKQFYTNANNARSFLINIYTSYFEILLKIKKALELYNLNEILEIKNHSFDIKQKLNQKTIEIFPDSEKLVYFLDILCLFNETNKNSLNVLFEYVNKYDDELVHKDLRTVAKITLANNLLISESQEDSEFIIRNLRLIYNYLSNGILSLKESVDDKNERELKEEILYWTEKIKFDENENLEFKSSLFTPIIDEKSQLKFDKLNSLEKINDKSKHDLRRLNGDLTPKILIHSVLKTLVAFSNTSGGVLIIGVNNDKKIVGIENEFNSPNQRLQYNNRDGYGLFFDELIKTYIGDSFSSLLSRKFLKFPEGEVLIIDVKQSSNEVFLKKDDEGKDNEQLYIRNLSSSKELVGSELAKFIKNKHIQSIQNNIK
jgi:predicted RNA-binding protein with RPS1 domain